MTILADAQSGRCVVAMGEGGGIVQVVKGPLGRPTDLENCPGVNNPVALQGLHQPKTASR